MPIMATVCYCNGCRTAGKILQSLPGAEPILNKEGGTPYVLFRKDRARCLEGKADLAEHRLNAGTPTRRVVASCCNTFMFLDFTKGHWISINGSRLDIPGKAVDRRSGVFVVRLLWAFAQMRFRTPEIDFVGGKLDGIES